LQLAVFASEYLPAWHCWVGERCALGAFFWRAIIDVPAPDVSYEFFQGSISICIPFPLFVKPFQQEYPQQCRPNRQCQAQDYPEDDGEDSRQLFHLITPFYC
jgi:hypothetical protein